MQPRFDNSRRFFRSMAIAACLLAAGAIAGVIAVPVAGDMTAQDSATMVAFQPESFHAHAGWDTLWDHWR
ncbi:hypothetical protein LLG90_25335 [Aromatoleum toluclasticum]|uniref:hypothetical protein n=1 Tax=Aromatoleum toluclasticum TaxID=92003 RepID=UPI0003775B74|nr:hypothetical protein [Aromatoleum toluclasticum]MCC4118688.1 hypothetical protein [Aromatoleum toluclasticum]